MVAEDLAFELEDVREENPWTDIPDAEWVPRLSAVGLVHDEAVSSLLQLMLRAARHQISRMPMAMELGTARRDEIAHTAADDATMAVLQRLERFEGRSRFTTWAYKFGILCAGVQVRRSVWHDRSIVLHDVPEIVDGGGTSPSDYSETRELAGAIGAAMMRVLTPHQRRIALALLVEEVPIDVLAERLATTRGALYKTLHDARKRLRTQLVAEGFLASRAIEEVGR
ncbi:MAG: sigma-70 family RNA polymerase sigma factor [Microbacterium sp.]